MFIILQWSCIKNISLVLDEEGTLLAFTSFDEAETYAKLNMADQWFIVYLEIKEVFKC